MKIRNITIGLVFILIVFALCGCSKAMVPQPIDDEADWDESLTVNPNIYFQKLTAADEQYEPSMPAFAIIINSPTAEQLAAYPATEEITGEVAEETFLLIPYSTACKVEVLHVDSFNEDGTLETSVEYESAGLGENPDDYVLKINSYRGDTVPAYVLRLTSQEGDVKEYWLACNGKDGNPNIEYIY